MGQGNSEQREKPGTRMHTCRSCLLWPISFNLATTPNRTFSHEVIHRLICQEESSPRIQPLFKAFTWNIRHLGDILDPNDSNVSTWMNCKNKTLNKRHKIICTVWFHLYKIPEQAKQNSIVYGYIWAGAGRKGMIIMKSGWWSLDGRGLCSWWGGEGILEPANTRLTWVAVTQKFAFNKTFH